MRIALFLMLSIGIIVAYFATQPAHPQAQWYHDFADQRTLLQVPHACNVLSNLPFLVVGLVGIGFMVSPRSHRKETFLTSGERWPYWAYFIGLTLTGIGSAYYHANPNNETLVWDRMPLTLAFMGLFCAVLAERLDVRLATWLLPVLLVMGVGSVIYWHWTETQGVGDLRPYFVVQFYPLIALPLLLAFFPARYTRQGDLWAALSAYGLAKGLEAMDGHIYTANGIVSGHTLKHLVAGISSGLVLAMLWHRQPCPP